MGIDELKQLRDNFIKLKQEAEETYIECSSFDADKGRFSFLINFRKKYIIVFLIFMVFSIISSGLSSLGILSIDWLSSLLSILFLGGSIASAIICITKANKISQKDHQKKRDLLEKYLINQELVEDLTEKINNTLKELDEETKANNQELIDSCLEEIKEYNDSNLMNVGTFIDSAFLYFLSGANEDYYDEDENEEEQLFVSEESEPINQGNTRKLNQ